MKDEIKEILEFLSNENYYIQDIDCKFKRLYLDEVKTLLDYITNLQKEKEALKERIAYLERSNDRREDTIISLRMDITDLEDILYKLEKYLEEKMLYAFKNEIGYYKEILDKLKELKENK